MPRDYFAQYAKQHPQEYIAFSNSMWNTFVSITHSIGLKHFFSFTPDFVPRKERLAAQDGQFKAGELDKHP